MSNKIRYLGKSLKSAGYSTIGIQGSKRSSFRIDQSLKIAGFDEVFGAEDMRDFSGDEVQISLPFDSVWDGNIFRFINSKKFNEPFLLLFLQLQLICRLNCQINNLKNLNMTKKYKWLFK